MRIINITINIKMKTKEIEFTIMPLKLRYDKEKRKERDKNNHSSNGSGINKCLKQQQKRDRLKREFNLTIQKLEIKKDEMIENDIDYLIEKKHKIFN